MKRSGSIKKFRGQLKQKHQNKKTKGEAADDPQIPQPDLRFATRSNSKNTTEKGARAQRKPKHTRIATRHRGSFPPCHKNMQKMKLIVYIHQRLSRHSETEEYSNCNSYVKQFDNLSTAETSSQSPLTCAFASIRRSVTSG